MFRRPSTFRRIVSAAANTRAASSRAESDRIAAAFKKSTLKTKVRNPMVPLLVLVSFVSSAVITVASYQQELDALHILRDTKRAGLQQIVERLRRGEDFDVDRAVEQLTVTDADKTLEELMHEIEESETGWMISEPQETKSTAVEAVTPPLQTGSDPVVSDTASEPKSSPAPARSTSKFL
ncbi:hypothetical protein D0Z03_002394 [Geotrichum reessii]|nr:hypothetical protein D0Z03_002394 [Galactomyces reessii]